MEPLQPRTLAPTKEAAVYYSDLPEPMQTFVDHDDRQGQVSPRWLTSVYGSLTFPAASADRPYVYANFVQGMDGIVSFQLPGAMSGGAVAGFNAQDQFLMAVLRAAADAVMVGAGTLRAEPEHRWIPEHIYPKAGARWAELRQFFGKQPDLINAFVTASGDIDLEAVVFHQPNIRCVVFTTTAGAAKIEERRAAHPTAALEVVVVGEDRVDLTEMLRRFRTEFGVEHLLVEGGPQLMGDFVAQGLMDGIFLTDAPQVIGTDGKRPTWAKGHPFAPDTAKWYELVSLKGWGDYVFRRYRRK